MAKKHKNKHMGSSFEDFLHDEGIYEDVTQSAIKAVLSRQIAEHMKNEKLSKTAMANRMQTSRAALDRLLDPEHQGVTLGTLAKAANAIGRSLRFELV